MGALRGFPRFLAYAQLMRLPNVFTAFADIGLAWAAAQATVQPPKAIAFIFLMAASGALYLAGMVWNDFFDLEEDRRERPFRPLPSGRIRRSTAAGLGMLLLAVGLSLAALASWADGSEHQRPLLLAGILAVTILAYDAVAKRFWLGPIVMGLCRCLNVLFGLSLIENLGPLGWHLPAVIGLYIVGVTWFAKTEAQTSSQPALLGAALVMAAAIVLGLLVPIWLPPGTSSPMFLYMLAAFAFAVGSVVVHAIRCPTPPQVQAAVKRAVLGLILLDATLATAFVGLPGLVLLLLYAPAHWLGRWVYST